MPGATLYLFVGYPGAGKTTVAQAITKASGAVHIWADTERNKRFPNPSHSEKESAQLYETLNEQTGDLLRSGQDVLFDTNFNYRSDRDKLRQIADAVNAHTQIIWITTPRDLAKERAVHSNVIRNGYDFAMSETQFDSIADKLEEPNEDENVIKIDGTDIDESQVMQLLGKHG